MTENRILQHFANNSLKDGVCRLCLRFSDNFMNIYETTDENHKPISDILEVLISLKVTHNNGYPEVICKECLDKTVAASEFKLKCEESSAILKKCYDIYHSKTTNENMKPDDNVDTDYSPPFEDEIRQNEDKDRNCKEDTVGGFDCKYCYKSFFTLSNLQNHMVTFTHNFQCKLCTKVCRSKKKLRKHYEKHKKNKEILCPYCEGLVKNNLHCDSFVFVCHYCEFVYPCKYFLEKHIASEHSDGVVYKKTADNSDLLINSTNIEECVDSQQCNECHRMFKTARHLNLHIVANNCKYVCDYCGVVYKSKDPLKLHVMTKHINYKPYRCHICDKTFALKTILKSHSVVHTKERNFQCDFCGKSFVCSVTLRYHRRLHTGERPYRCTTCGEGFVNTSRLRDHEQVKHIGKVQCPICLSTFTKRSTLKQHMDKLHPNTYVKGQKYLMFEGTER